MNWDTRYFGMVCFLILSDYEDYVRIQYVRTHPTVNVVEREPRLWETFTNALAAHEFA